MTKITFEGDLPGSVGNTIPGMELPKQFEKVPLRHLRLVGGKIVDASKLTSFYVDEVGQKHVEKSKPSWQKVDVGIDEPIVLDGKTWRKETLTDALAPLIKTECRRRILAVADLETQVNLLRLHSEVARGETKTKKPTAARRAQADTVETGMAWIDAMRSACQTMIEEGETRYDVDAKWPTAPEAFVQLANEV